MAHNVICLYCKQRFDRDKEEYAVVSNRRYAHKKCYEVASAEEKQAAKDKELLYNCIKRILGADALNNARVHKQIEDFKKQYNFTYTGMERALTYFFDVKKNPVSKANGGIGIIPYIYQDAYNYYYSIWISNQKPKEEVRLNQQAAEEIVIPVPQRKMRKRKMFTFLDEENIDGE